MSIKYRYATVDNGNTVEINSVLPTERKKEYTCLGCGSRLIPSLGKVIQHHFKHKGETNCSPESYLHRLAKLKFYEVYQNCLENNLPFFINFQVNQKCSLYENTLPVSCSESTTEQWEITKFFPRIKLEVNHQDFIPDILLESANGTPIYIEIKVSHGCSVEKINSGNRIIEIDISSEEEIESLSSCELTESPQVKFRNFIKERTRDSCNGDCSTTVSAFAVYPSGKSILFNSVQIPELANVRKGAIHFELLPLLPDSAGLAGIPDWASSGVYKEMIVKAFQDNIPIKNCFLCRYHGENRSSSGIFCKFLKLKKRSNFASECNFFLPDPAVFLSYPD